MSELHVTLALPFELEKQKGIGGNTHSVTNERIQEQGNTRRISAFCLDSTH